MEIYLTNNHRNKYFYCFYQQYKVVKIEVELFEWLEKIVKLLVKVVLIMTGQIQYLDQVGNSKGIDHK